MVTMQCPACMCVFDIFEPGELVLGADEHGLYLQHSCGHKGRPGDGPPPADLPTLGWCMCGHHQSSHWAPQSGCATGPPCYCGLFVQRTVPMPGPRRPDGSY